VDDNESIQEFLSEVLTTWGPFHSQPCDIQTAGSVEEAFAAVDARAFDLMILDMVLGDGNGLQVLQGLQDRPAAPPVIVLSAEDPADLRNKCAEMGARAFLRKGDGIEALVREALMILNTAPERALPVDVEEPGPEEGDSVGRVLVVDDDPLVCEALASMMELLENVEVRTAAGGESGVEIAREWKPHVMLLDIAMPDMDGRQALEILMGEGSKTRVVMISGFRDSEVAKECVERGAADYIPKPVDFTFLKKAVTGHLALAKRESNLEQT
jgi:CheY-like chemotaxis protein